MKPISSLRKRHSGFTLIEAIMVIVLTGILAGVVAVFIARPVQGYADAVKRAELTDAADVALRRITRDVRLALPNSLRLMASGGRQYIEFIMTSAGGRYRDESDGSTAGNFLNFTDSSKKTFDVLGIMPSSPAIAANDYVVVYNLGEGYAPADAYAAAGNNNRALISGIAGNTITLASNPFAAQSPPLPSPNARFQVIPGGVGAVTYSCPTAVAGTLERFANYGFNPSQAVPNVTPALLGRGAACTIEYTANDSTGRNGILFISLRLTDASSGESVTLFHQIHVDNSP